MSPRVRPFVALAAVTILAGSPRARSQGIIIDVRANRPVARSYEVREVAVEARVRDQVAEVQVSQTFHNPGSTVLESEYFFPLPEEGAIQNFVLMVDGKELPGRLLPKDEARRIFEEIVRTRRDPALLEYMGRGVYRTSVFPIPPGADRKVTMRYTQLCRRDRDVVEFAYPFGTQKNTARPIQRLALNVQIHSRQAIKSVYSPTSDTTITRDGDHEARVRFEQHGVIPDADFRLVYTLAEGSLGATVLSYRPSAGEDGYFLLLASPQVKRADVTPQPKTVIFVLDRSGSMAGKKIEQARQALQSVLDNLGEDDLFNIVVYDDQVETFQPELARYGPASRRKAERFVKNIREGGATNIDAALTTALGMVHDDSRPSYVIFLTDGLPTAGETGELAIADRCRKANLRHARLFVFGVGFDVNARLLDRLSGGNAGTSVYVKPDENLEAYVGRFSSKLTSPVLSNIRIALDGTDVNRTYPRDVPDLFDGAQLVWVGRYRESGPATLRLTGKVGRQTRRFEFPVQLASAGQGSTYDFVERIWAVRRVGHIIDQIDLSGPNKELTDELVALSTRYGILTPYTSFLAEETVPLHARAANSTRALEALRELQVVSGASGVAQRSTKQSYLEADRPVALARAEPSGASTYETRTGRVPALMPAASAPAGGQSQSGPPVRGMRLGTPGNTAPATGAPSAGSAVRQVGAKTFYFKNQRWVDSAVGPEREAQARVIEQFSDEFFRLARGQAAGLNQYLTFTEPVTVDLDGTVYRVEPSTR